MEETTEMREQVDLKDFRRRSNRKGKEQLNLSQEGGKRALGGSGGVRFLATIREGNLKTSGPSMWPLSEMVITACPLNFVQCWDFLEELPEEAFKVSLTKTEFL